MGGRYFNGKRVLIVRFAEDESLRQLTAEISRITGGDLLCPGSDMAKDWDVYDIIFIGCVADATIPVRLPAFVRHSGLQSKTVIPFCIYTTSCDKALRSIVDSTPEAEHLTGLGIKDVASSEVEIQTWINLINEQWNELNAEDCGKYAASGDAVDPSVDVSAPMQGTVNLWYKGNVPTVTRNAVNSDGADFIPNMRVFTVPANVMPKGAVIICPGGAFQFRGMRVEGYYVAEMLVSMGYQCFVVSYRIAPYTMQESTADLSRAIRYVRTHAKEYRIKAKNIALVGFSAGGLLCGEVLLNWQELRNSTISDSSYCPDALDEIPVSVCAIGLIYSFYGQMGVAMNDVETLRTAHLPPTFYNWGNEDSLDWQIHQNIDAVREAGYDVETHVLEDYPHGYGTGGSADVWIERFDTFLCRIMSDN